MTNGALLLTIQTILSKGVCSLIKNIGSPIITMIGQKLLRLGLYILVTLMFKLSVIYWPREYIILITDQYINELDLANHVALTQLSHKFSNPGYRLLILPLLMPCWQSLPPMHREVSDLCLWTPTRSNYSLLKRGFLRCVLLFQ